MHPGPLIAEADPGVWEGGRITIFISAGGGGGGGTAPAEGGVLLTGGGGPTILRKETCFGQ